MILDRNKMASAKDIIRMVLLVIITIFVHYLAPNLLRLLYYLFIAAVMLTSKKDYFWLSFIFVISSIPAGFMQFRYVFVLGKMAPTFLEIFSIIYLFKYINSKKLKAPNFYAKPFKLYIGYLIFLLFIGVSIGGGLAGGGHTGYQYLYNLSRMLTVLPFFFTLPFFINKREDIKSILILISVMLPINLLGQLYCIVFQIIPDQFLYQYYSIVRFDISDQLNYGLIRPAYGYSLSYVVLFLSLYYLSARNDFINKKLLIFNLIISFFSIFIMASRGWLLAIVFMIVSYIFISIRPNRIISATFSIAFGIIGIYLLTQFNATVKTQFVGAIERYDTLEKVMEGDLTAGGTNIRATRRHIPVWKKFLEKPVFGWGISAISFKYRDRHVGNQSLLLVGGIVGFSIFLYFVFNTVQKVFYISRRSSQSKDERKALLNIVGAFGGLLIIHSTSGQLFGFLTYTEAYHQDIVILLSLLFCIFNILQMNASKRSATNDKN